MTKPLIAGNWKMNNTINGGVKLVMRLRELVKTVEEVEILVAPPYIALHHLSHLIADSPIKLCAQNLYWEQAGAYTGEISADMLKDVGCGYVIIGHSERREYFGETSEMVRKKIIAALKADLKPIVCVGETLDEKEAGKTLDVVSSQVTKALKELGPGSLKNITLAYEPVWAIGTGLNATPEEAEEVHNSIRQLIFETFGNDPVKEVRIIYGGSVKPSNIDALMAKPNIDGALVGGASLNADDFARIIKFNASGRP